MLPELIKLCEICDDREQFKWINKTMLHMCEKIPLEDTISHNYIVFLLLKSYAVLIPNLSELQHLQPIINKYLSNNQLFIRNATLNGLLSLFECLWKTNTTIGSLSEELILLRHLIINYITKHGIVFERWVIPFVKKHSNFLLQFAVKNYSAMFMQNSFGPSTFTWSKRRPSLWPIVTCWPTQWSLQIMCWNGRQTLTCFI